MEAKLGRNVEGTGLPSKGPRPPEAIPAPSHPTYRLVWFHKSKHPGSGTAARSTLRPQAAGGINKANLQTPLGQEGNSITQPPSRQTGALVLVPAVAMDVSM